MTGAPVSHPVIEGVSGAVGAVIAMTATYPLLTVVTLRALETRDDGAGGRRLPGALALLPSAVQEVIHHARDKGWRSLYSGLKPAVVATAASQGVYFYCYSLLRGWAVAAQLAAATRQKKLRRRAARQAGLPPPPEDEASDAHNAEIGVGASLVVAAAAGCINVVLTIPMWVVITQMQAAARRPRGGGGAGPEGGGGEDGAWATARRLYRERGLGAFYQGLRPSLVMVVNPTVQYVLYEWMVARLRDLRRPAAAARGRKPRVGPADVFVISSLAKIGATLATYPMLVIKSRLQAVNRHTEEGMRYEGVWDAVRRMAADEGVAGFYRGMRVKLAQTVLAAALMMMLKEEIYEWTHAALTSTAAVAAAAAGGGKGAARAPRLPSR